MAIVSALKDLHGVLESLLGPTVLESLPLSIPTSPPIKICLPKPRSVPPLSEVRQVVTTDRTFSVMAPLLWNVLSIEAHKVPIFFSFRHQAKTYFFFTLAFNYGVYLNQLFNSLLLFYRQFLCYFTTANSLCSNNGLCFNSVVVNCKPPRAGL